MNKQRSWIPHSASKLGIMDLNSVKIPIESNFIGYGAIAQELERCFCCLTGRKYAFAVSSGFHALSLAIQALDLPPKSIISLPVLTCSSVLAAVTGAGHYPYLTDIKELDLTLDPQLVSDRSAAIIAPHAYGAPLDVESLKQLDIPWIEDCATSPSTIAGERVAGASGTFAIFSLNSTKYITGGTGGILVTDDSFLADKVSDLLEYDRQKQKGFWIHHALSPIPGKLADLNAALALSQLEQLSEFTSRRQTIAEKYNSGLDCLSDLRLPQLLPGHSFYRYIIRTQFPSINVVKAFQARGIDARTSVNPWLHLRKNFYHQIPNGSFPVADSWREHLLSLPIHPAMSDRDIEYVRQTAIALVRNLKNIC